MKGSEETRTGNIDSLNAEAWNLRYVDSKASCAGAEKALALSRKHEYARGQAYAFLTLGVKSFLKSENKDALEFFSDALTRVPGALAVCARPGLLERPVDLGRMVHLALPTPWGCELHSRFWLGYVARRDGTRLPVGVGNAPWVRRLLARTTFGRALAVHCHEEMTTLAGFLPDLYASGP